MSSALRARLRLLASLIGSFFTMPELDDDFAPELPSHLELLT